MIKLFMRGVESLSSKYKNMAEAIALSGKAKIDVGSDLGYAQVVVHGSQPHIITPRSANGVLISEDGTFGPVRWAVHPGTKPNPFGRRALEHVRPALLAEYHQMIVGDVFGIGVARAEAAKIKIGALLLHAVQEEAPVKSGDLRNSLHLMGSMENLL